MLVPFLPLPRAMFFWQPLRMTLPPAGKEQENVRKLRQTDP
jgi:hypothetical protein